LTFEELVHESGVSRGGIIYHFATKSALLRALIERNVEQGRAVEARLLAQVDAGPGADLIARIRAWGTLDEDRKRLVAGLLSAVAHDPSLLEPVRRMHAEECARIEWNDTEIRRAILRLAAEGLFWSEFFACSEVPPEQRARLLARLEALAREWSGGTA
jgi:AcrR family transcriptional regulator